MKLPGLYPHHQDLRDRTRSALAKHRRVVLCAQTGVGKTRIAKWVLGSAISREPKQGQSGRALFTVHRRGLVDNASESFQESPAVPHGVVMSGRETMYGRRLQIASIDTLLNWFIDDGEYPSDVTFDLIIFDEAHSHHPKLAKFLRYHDERREQLELHPAYVIGLSATPEAKGLSDIYSEIVSGPSTEWLISNNYLCPFRYFRATEGQLGKLVRRGGEFTQKSVAAAMGGLSGDLVRDWKRFAEGRPTVGFFPRQSHAKEALQALSEAGLRVEYIDSETADDDRRMIFRALNEHRIDYLCNVQVVERGTDIPAISCVQLCVAVGSVSRYRQMIGRGSRMHASKTDCLVLDHGGNVSRHGFFQDDPEWTLDYRTKETGEVATKPTIECPQCQAIYRGGLCAAFGYEPTREQRSSQGLTFDGSELKEVKPTQEKPKGKSPEALIASCITAAGRSGRTWKQCVAMYLRKSREQGTPEYRVPSVFDLWGARYKAVRFGSTDSNRRVSALYPVVVGRGHGGPLLIQEARV